LAQIHIDCSHGLPFATAQAIAAAWAQGAKDDFGMQVHPATGPSVAGRLASWQFKRVGASGTLNVTGERFVLDVELGFLLGTYKDRIESELLQTLAQRLAEAQTNLCNSQGTGESVSKS
jgi:putative polyhydroxyalkanoate system protein